MTRNSRTLAFEQREAGQVLSLDTEHIIARNELAPMAADVCQGTEAVKLRLEDEIRMIEWLRDAGEPHRCDEGH